MSPERVCQRSRPVHGILFLSPWYDFVCVLESAAPNKERGSCWENNYFLVSIHLWGGWVGSTAQVQSEEARWWEWAEPTESEGNVSYQDFLSCSVVPAWCHPINDCSRISNLELINLGIPVWNPGPLRKNRLKGTLFQP